MNDLVCPHCHTRVPRGATVCTGCQAEVKYGPANGVFGIALLAGAVVGYKASHALPESMSVGGWIAGLAVFGGLSFLIQKMFADRVVFNRVYRSK